ncbi:MAG TPA: hypothetical protein VGE34_01310 [Candidatus Saccharimonadales bacterium]
MTQRSSKANLAKTKVIFLSVLLLFITATVFAVKVIQIDPVHQCSYRYTDKGSNVLMGPPDKEVSREYMPFWSVGAREERLYQEGRCYHIDFWWAPNKVQVNYS